VTRQRGNFLCQQSGQQKILPLQHILASCSRTLSQVFMPNVQSGHNSTLGWPELMWYLQRQAFFDNKCTTLASNASAHAASKLRAVTVFKGWRCGAQHHWSQQAGTVRSRCLQH
jgi:hypothetical protein